MFSLCRDQKAKNIRVDSSLSTCQGINGLPRCLYSRRQELHCHSKLSSCRLGVFNLHSLYSCVQGVIVFFRSLSSCSYEHYAAIYSRASYQSYYCSHLILGLLKYYHSQFILMKPREILPFVVYLRTGQEYGCHLQFILVQARRGIVIRSLSSCRREALLEVSTTVDIWLRLRDLVCVSLESLVDSFCFQGSNFLGIECFKAGGSSHPLQLLRDMCRLSRPFLNEWAPLIQL